MFLFAEEYCEELSSATRYASILPNKLLALKHLTLEECSSLDKTQFLKVESVSINSLKRVQRKWKWL